MENKMKTIRIRKSTILSLFIILLLPWIFYVGAQLVVTKTISFGMTDSQQQSLESTVHVIETNSENWTNHSWQNELRRQLKKKNMDVSILSESNQEIFRTTSDRNHSFMRTEQFTIIQDGQVLGRVDIYLSDSKIFQMIAAFIGLLVAFFIVGYGLRKFILIPLEEMSISARRIAEGDFDVHLPLSRITEIAEVRDGFNVMVEGLKESFQKQLELEGERRFVIAAVAHDLRTPLFALRGYLDGLEKGIAHSPDKVAKYLAVCKEKSTQLDRLVEDLFTFTKTDYLEIKLNENKIDLALVLMKSMDSLSPQARQKHISMIENNFADDCVVMGDSHILERAMNNLIDNAVRHTPCCGKIFVKCYKDSNKVIFTVQDTGEGFSSDELQRVFEPLYRGEASRNRSTGGVGLGLTISQRIIRQHGGDLVVGNHPEGGAILTGWIPLDNNSPY